MQNSNRQYTMLTAVLQLIHNICGFEAIPPREFVVKINCTLIRKFLRFAQMSEPRKCDYKSSPYSK